MDRPRSRDVTLALTAISLVAVLMFAIVAAYVWHTSNEDEPGIQGILSIGYMENVDSLNPLLATTEPALALVGLVYDCLHSVGEDLEPGPNLALNSTPVDDYLPYGSAWDYDITPNAVWHDGVPLSVDDVVYTLNFCASNYSLIWMYQRFTYFIDHAEKIDRDTVRVHFFDRGTGEPMPVAFADSLLIPILPKHLLQNLSAAQIAFEWLGYFEGSSPPLVGTGPFMATEDIVDDWVTGDGITLTRNPRYHWNVDRDESVQFESVRMRFFDDSFALRLALEHMDLDVAELPLDQYSSVKELLSEGELREVAVFDGLTCAQRMCAVTFNSHNAPNPIINDTMVRRALAMATNRSAVVGAEYQGYADEGSTVISPAFSGWHLQMDAQDLYAFDLEAAEALLDGCGYVFTEDSPDVRVASLDSAAVKNGWVPVNTSLSFEAIVQQSLHMANDVIDQLVSDWGLLGVELDFHVLGGVVVPISVSPTDLWVFESSCGDTDPTRSLFGWSSGADSAQSPYFCASENESFDQLVISTASELSQESRRTLVHDCQREFYRDVGAMVLAYPYSTYAWRTDTFEGWGDWEAHPGRSLDARWGGNELFFDLQPIMAMIVESAAVPLWAFVAMGASAAVAVASLVAVLRIKRGA